jgi:DNA polymerase-3 subunit gamma/tau
MRGATAPRLLLEVVCARLLLPSASDTEAALLQRVERIETRLDLSIPDGQGTPAQYTRKSKAAPAPEAAPVAETPAQPIVEPAPPAPKAEAKPAPSSESKPPSPPPVRPPSDPVVEAPPPAAVAGEPNAAAVRSMWTTILEKVRQRSRTTEVMLASAIVRAVEGDTLVLSHESAPLAKRLVEQRNSDAIREALKDALGVDWKVRCEVGGAASPPAERASTATEAPAPPQRDDDDEESMLAEASNDVGEVTRRDPEEAALELLQSELGARRIDGT